MKIFDSRPDGKGKYGLEVYAKIAMESMQNFFEVNKTCAVEGRGKKKEEEENMKGHEYM